MSRNWSVVVAAIALLMMAVGAHAQNVNAVRKTAMATMLVTGEIEIKPDGQVQSYTLDQQDKLSPVIRGFLAKTIPSWVFEPMTQPDASSLRSKMSVRLVAEPVGDAYEMRVRSASFGSDPQPGLTAQPGLTTVEMKPPVYPPLAAQVGAAGTVYLVFEVGRDGKVIHADAEQTNLKVLASERDMATLREQFERAALKAAKDWTFQIPTVGEEASKNSWFVRIPIQYSMEGQENPPSGTWDQYIPGPRKPIPWYEANKAAYRDQGLEAGLEGQVFQLGSGPILRTRLDTDS